MSVTASPRTSTPATPARVVLADDQSLFRASLRHLLAVPRPVLQDVYGVDVGAGFRVVGEAATGEETVRVVQSARPDLLILAPSIPRVSGLDALRELETCEDSVPTILLADAISRRQLIRAVELAVRGFVLKDSPTAVLFQAILCVLAGRCWLEPALVTDLLEEMRSLMPSRASQRKPASGLTPREREVLAMVAAGCQNKDIASKYAISEQTVKHHLTRIFHKCGASNRLELAMAANQRGLDAAM